MVVALFGLIPGNPMEMSEENIENIIKSDNNFATSFVDDHVLPDINFNGHCLINNNNNISILKKSNKSIYLLYIKSVVKKFKQRET